MTPTATYIAEENCLQEESQVEKPVELNFYIESVYTGEPSFNDEAYEKALAAYNAHVATLRKIPCDPEPGFKDGEKYTEGVDYEIKGADEWKWCYQLKGNIFAAPIVSVKGEPDMPNLILTAFQNEPVTFLLSNALRHLTQDQQRQLCNALQERLPLPASIEQDAERLFPDVDESTDYASDDYRINEVRKFQRSAHIACARQYMGEIEQLRAENSKMRKALEGLSQFGGYVGTLATEALK